MLLDYVYSRSVTGMFSTGLDNANTQISRNTLFWKRNWVKWKWKLKDESWLQTFLKLKCHFKESNHIQKKTYSNIWY